MIHKNIFLLYVTFLMLACGCGSNSGQQALRQGLVAYKEKDYTAAIALLTRATKRISDSANLYYYLGSAHLIKGEMEQSATAFHAAIDLNPRHGEALAGLGQIAYYQKESRAAQNYFEKALAAEITSAESKAIILNGLALTLSDQKKYDLARLYFLRALQISRTYAPTLYNLGSLYRDAYGLREEALDQFELYVRMIDTQSRYHEKAENNIKRLRLNLKRTQADEQDALRRDSAKAAQLLQAGVQAQNTHQPTKALKAYREALTADPSTLKAALGLATICKSQGLYLEAMEAFKRATLIEPMRQDSYQQAAELALQLKRYEEAEKILDRAIARSPFNPLNVDLMARIRHAEKRNLEARSYGEFCLSLLRVDDQKRPAYAKWVASLPVK